MDSQFIEITCIERGNEFNSLVNVDDIARLVYGFNLLFFKTPFTNGEYHVSITQKEFDRLEKILLKR